MVPVALTNTDATAAEATHGAPVIGPGVAQPFPPDADVAAMPSVPAKPEADEPDIQVSVLCCCTVCCYMLPVCLHIAASHVAVYYGRRLELADRHENVL